MHKVLKRYLLPVLLLGICVNCTALKQSNFKFAPPGGLIYDEATETSTSIYTSGTFLAETSAKFKSEVRVKKTSEGFEFINLIKSAKQYSFGEPVVSSFMNSLEGRELKYLVDSEGKVKDLEGVERIIEEAVARDTLNSGAGLRDMAEVIKLDFMTRWQERVESTLAIRGVKWAVEKDLHMIADGGSKYFVAYRVVGKTECGGVEKCVLVDYSYHNDKSELKGYKIKFLNGKDVRGSIDSNVSFNIDSVFVSGSGARVVDPITSVVYTDYYEFVVEVEATLDGGMVKKLKTVTKYDYSIDLVKNVN